MNIMLGNLSREDIEKRCGVTFSEEVQKFLDETREQKAEVKDDNKWHCFDMPFTIVCGNKEFANKVLEMLSPYGKDMECPLGIGWNKE